MSGFHPKNIVRSMNNIQNLPPILSSVNCIRLVFRARNQKLLQAFYRTCVVCLTPFVASRWDLNSKQVASLITGTPSAYNNKSKSLLHNKALHKEFDRYNCSSDSLSDRNKTENIESFSSKWLVSPSPTTSDNFQHHSHSSKLNFGKYTSALSSHSQSNDTHLQSSHQPEVSHNYNSQEAYTYRSTVKNQASLNFLNNYYHINVLEQHRYFHSLLRQATVTTTTTSQAANSVLAVNNSLKSNSPSLLVKANDSSFQNSYRQGRHLSTTRSFVNASPLAIQPYMPIIRLERQIGE